MIKSIVDLLKRIAEALESVNGISADHNHDTDYAPTGHTHNYADPSHNHDTDYAPTGHTHNYADPSHNHDTDYASTGHTHNYLTQATADSLYAPIGGGGGGLAVSYGLVQDQKPQGTDGGTFTAGAWRTRTLNTIAHGSYFLSLSNNVLTIEAGEYALFVSAPAHRVNNHQVRVRNLDNGAVYPGTPERNSSGSGVQTRSVLVARLSLPTSNRVVVEHRCETSYTTNGLGRRSNWATEIYTIFEIWRLT